MGNKPSLPANEAIYHAAKNGRDVQLDTILRNVRPDTRPESLLEWQDEDGRTALVVAAAKDHLRCLEILLRHRANVQHMSRRKEGGTALHEAVFKHCNKRIVDMLLKYGASPFVENVTRFTAMDYAIVKRDAGLLRLLEKYGYFSQYMRVRIRRNFGFSKAWVPKWVAVVPRYGCPLRPQQQSRRLLFIYNDARSFDPICKVYLDGATVRQVVGDNGEVQALLALHHSHVQPKGVAASKDTAGQWIINFRAHERTGQQVAAFVDAIHSQGGSPVLAFDGENDEALARRLARYGSADDHFRAGVQAQVPAATFASAPILHPPEYEGPEDVLSPIRSEDEEQVAASAPPLPPDYYASAPQETNDHVTSQPTFDPLGQDSANMDDNLCVVCLDKPKCCGFVHGTSMHRCVCQDCAKTLQESGDGLCPVCRQKIEHVITDFFY